MRRRAILGYGAAGVAAVALMLFVGWWQVDGPGGPEPVGQRPVALTEMDFRLTDHEGNAVGPETLIGRPTMAFFGFTYCPDVCPTTLADISGWLDDLGDEADEMNVVFHHGRSRARHCRNDGRICRLLPSCDPWLDGAGGADRRASRTASAPPTKGCRRRAAITR